jgi:acyl-CoA reductase-like NAD-dependent aldehyde dehydrogenase
MLLHLQAGSVFVNSPGAVDDTLPFGGYKESGVGRDKGEAALHHCKFGGNSLHLSCFVHMQQCAGSCTCDGQS